MPTNHENEEPTEDVMTRLREHLDDELSPELKRRLQQSRHAALDSMNKKTLFSVPTLLPALGVTAALALGVGIAWNSLQYSTNPGNDSDQQMASEEILELDELIYLAENSLQDDDLQILLASGDNPDLDLDFLTWASEQPEFL